MANQTTTDWPPKATGYRPRCFFDIEINGVPGNYNVAIYNLIVYCEFVDEIRQLFAILGLACSRAQWHLCTSIGIEGELQWPTLIRFTPLAFKQLQIVRNLSKIFYRTIL